VKPIDLDEIWEAFGLREALETYAVERAIKSGNSEDIKFLEEKRITHALYTPPYYTQRKFLLDIEFHTQIASMAKNKIIEFQLKRNFEHLYLRSRLNDYDVTRMKVSASDHKSLVDRIKKKDILGSIEFIRLHVQSARDLVINCLSKEME
ncbi:GntR family transcriptional regulator, partial [Thermodesulfobacteriota bacterium]